jgi:hypothetical protein
MKKGVMLHDLLASKVFNMTFDFDNWPGNHNDDVSCIRAYNGSFFDIRNSYSLVFPDILPMEQQKKEFGENEHNHLDKQKIYKIKYSINLLAQIDMYVVEENNKKLLVNEGISLMNLCGETDELDIFDTEALN